MKKVVTIFCTCFSIYVSAQQHNYTVANAHSHNDYEQSNPFYEAWQNGFGSIEADIFLQDGKLLVAHEINELNSNRFLDSLYLKPLQKAIEKNKGYPYAHKNKQLQLLIDVKSDSVATLNKLINKNYSRIILLKHISLGVSGENKKLCQHFCE